MKLLVSSIALVLLGNSVVAAPIGGHVDLGYEWSTVNSASNDDYHGDEFAGYTIEGSIGGTFSGVYGWQVDAFNTTQDFTDDSDSFLTASSFSLHINRNVSGYTLGAFVGGGVSEFTTHPTESTMYWYGIEGARSFGDFMVVAQLGMASVDSEHDGLNTSDEFFGAIEARYFLNDGLMFTANYNISNGMIHSDTLVMSEFSVGATMKLGSSNFYANANYAIRNYDSDDSNIGGDETAMSIGVSYMFGGGLRDTYTNTTPMLSNTRLATLGTYSYVYDD